MTSSARALLTSLGWSTLQGDQALAGSMTARAGDPVSVCPHPPASSLAYPWQAGWIATAAQLFAPNPCADRTSILRVHGATASLGLYVHAELSC